jgi:hypothetical protein
VLLYKIRQLTIVRVKYAPVTDLRALTGVGPRIIKHYHRRLDEPIPALRGHGIKD